MLDEGHAISTLKSLSTLIFIVLNLCKDGTASLLILEAKACFALEW